MDDIILSFLQAYKKLDRLCRDLLHAENGVTEYIEAMYNVSPDDGSLVSSWFEDRKQLKYIRHVRNRLVHEENSFDKPGCTEADIRWINDFHDRILARTDPLAELNKQKRRKLLAQGWPVSSTQKQKEGCYIATCVYGSYDCPQVRALRRYRDGRLSATRCGRLFIRLYYTVSPMLVRLFGNTGLFRRFWRKRLDRMVELIETMD